MCYCGSLPSRLLALAALCPHGSLPSLLSALPSISLTLLPVAGAARKCRRMLALSSPLTRPCALTGMHLQPPIKMPPPSPSPSSRVLCLIYTIYLTRDRAAQRVCSPGAGLNPPEFLSPCGLPVSCCLATSVVRSRNSKRLAAPPRVYVCICMDSAGPTWSSLAQDLHGSGRHESGIRTVPLPGTLACAAPR